MCKICNDLFVGNTHNTLNKQQNKDSNMHPKRHNTRRKSESFTAYFDQHFTKRPSPQQCHTIMNFVILCTVNPISSMKA